MKLSEFLAHVGCLEKQIINYKGKEALEKVQQNGYNLKFVTKQTPEICLAAVKEQKDAIRFVDKSVFEIEKINLCEIHAKIYGESIEFGKHQVHTEIKAVTYHMLKISQDANGWEAKVIFDI